MDDFFVSYTRADRSWAEWIAWVLEEAGYTVRIQAWDFLPGTNFVLEMNRAIKDSKKLLAVISPDYLGALQTQSEFYAAFESRRLLPVRVREVNLSGLFAAIVYIDLVDLSEAAAREMLISNISGGRSKPVSRPAFPGTSQPVFPGYGGGYPGEAEANHRGELDAASSSIDLLALYSKNDEDLWREFQIHLGLLQRTGVLRRVKGITIDGEMSLIELPHDFRSYKLIIPMISSDFLASPILYSDTMATAIDHHSLGRLWLIPVVLRPAVLKETPLGSLAVLPRDGRPVVTWSTLEEAFTSVTEGVRLACREISGLLVLQPIPLLPHDAKPNKRYSVVDVFKPSGVPSVTFVEPDDFYLLKLALEHPGRGVVVEGPSGIGKTSAVRKAVEQLQAERRMADITVLSARLETHSHQISQLVKWHEGPVVIDDFHRLEHGVRRQLTNYLKYLADVEDSRKKLILIGIPGTGKNLVDLSFDIATRMDVIRMGRVSDDVVLSMIEKGEAALNICFDRKSEVVRLASGSLNIAQILCSIAAARAGIMATQEVMRIVRSDLDGAVKNAMAQMALKFADLVRAFASLGGSDDRTCIELLYELGQTSDGLLSLAELKDRRSDLTKGIERFISGGLMNEMCERFPSYEHHILYDAEMHVLLADDPQLRFYLHNTPVSALVRDTGKSSAAVRNRIFISYSHADSDWLQRLRVHLKPFERKGLVDVWDDTKIRAGSKWKDEIKSALDAARVAILLVSPDFLASDFIFESELPILLAAAEGSGTRVLPLILRPSRLEEADPISHYQFVNPISKPLSSVSPSEQDEILVHLAEQVDAALSGSLS